MNLVAESHQAFHCGTAPIFALLTSEQMRDLAALEGDPALADRVEELADKANEGELTSGSRRFSRDELHERR